MIVKQASVLVITYWYFVFTVIYFIDNLNCKLYYDICFFLYAQIFLVPDNMGVFHYTNTYTGILLG